MVIVVFAAGKFDCGLRMRLSEKRQKYKLLMPTGCRNYSKTLSSN